MASPTPRPDWLDDVITSVDCAERQRLKGEKRQWRQERWEAAGQAEGPVDAESLGSDRPGAVRGRPARSRPEPQGASRAELPRGAGG